MRMVRIPLEIPKLLKAKLDAERKRDTSATGLTRHLLGQYFESKKAAQQQCSQLTYNSFAVGRTHIRAEMIGRYSCLFTTALQKALLPLDAHDYEAASTFLDFLQK